MSYNIATMTCYELQCARSTIDTISYKKLKWPTKISYNKIQLWVLWKRWATISYNELQCAGFSTNGNPPPSQRTKSPLHIIPKILSFLCVFWPFFRNPSFGVSKMGSFVPQLQAVVRIWCDEVAMKTMNETKEKFMIWPYNPWKKAKIPSYTNSRKSARKGQLRRDNRFGVERQMSPFWKHQNIILLKVTRHYIAGPKFVELLL